MTVEEVCKRLDQLKGMLLLRDTGTLYLLKGYSVEKGQKTIKRWFQTTTKTIDYISSMELSSGQIVNFTVDDDSPSRTAMNHLIADRQRYMNMLRTLSRLGYTIKKK